MARLENLEPKEVFYYFEKIAGIPHGSRNTKAISDYCVSVAREKGLRYIQDESNNVIIYKDASPGCEKKEPVILQGHLDMVCVKEKDSPIDMERDGLDLQVEGDDIYARGTTLGGDDGIAVAYCLAILADDTLVHPPLEVILTTDEEIGLLGAAALDASALKGRRLINLDSEEEGIFLTSCAGGVSGVCTLPVQYEEKRGTLYEIRLTGLLGGHSGVEIHKERANANKLMGRLLDQIGEKLEFSLAALEGGVKDNAIPSSASAEILIHQEEEGLLEEILKRMETIYHHEYRSSDPNITVEYQKTAHATRRALTLKSQELLLFLLMQAPDGVTRRSMEIEGLVQTSLNAGVMRLNEEGFLLDFAIRSSVDSEKEALSRRLQYLTEFLGGDYEENGDYPGWEYKKESPLRELMVRVYEEMFGQKPAVEAVHAGLECGVFAGKIPGIDCISLGPDMAHVHTVQERLSISSTGRMWKFLLEVLKKC